MKKKLFIQLSIFLLLLNTVQFIFGGFTQYSIGSGITLEDIGVTKNDTYIFGLDNANNANFRTYNYGGVLIKNTQFGISEKDYLTAPLRAMDVDGQNIVCAYVTDDQSKIVVRISTDGGSSWSTKPDILHIVNNIIRGLDVCLYNNNIYISDIEEGSGREYIRFVKSVFSAGGSWTGKIITSPLNPLFYGIGIDVKNHIEGGEYIHIVWGQIVIFGNHMFYFAVFHSYSRDGGANFTSPFLLTNPYIFWGSLLALFGGVIYLIMSRKKRLAKRKMRKSWISLEEQTRKF